MLKRCSDLERPQCSRILRVVLRAVLTGEVSQKAPGPWKHTLGGHSGTLILSSFSPLHSSHSAPLQIGSYHSPESNKARKSCIKTPKTVSQNKPFLSVSLSGISYSNGSLTVTKTHNQKPKKKKCKKKWLKVSRKHNRRNLLITLPGG